MFTGLIEEVGTVVAVRPRDHGTELQIAAPRTAKYVNPGESIAVNGCCLTLTSCRSNYLSFDLLEETIARTNLRDLQLRPVITWAHGDNCANFFDQSREHNLAAGSAK